MDISGSEGTDPYEDYQKINNELENYSAKLAGLPQIVCVNKTDLMTDEDLRVAVDSFEKKSEKKVISISAQTHKNVDELLRLMYNRLQTCPKQDAVIVDENFAFEKTDNSSFEIDREDDGTFVVYGGLIDMLARSVVISDADSLRFFQKVLLDKGIIDALRGHGAKDGDTIVVGDIEFEFIN